MNHRLSTLGLGLCLGLGSCFPSNILKLKQRSIIQPSAEIDWRPANLQEIPGLYTSTEINGPMANVLRRIVYLFDDDGTYTASALFYGPPAEFQVLRGTWTLEGALIKLDDSAPAPIEWGIEHIRISGEEGSVVLRQE